MRPVLFTNLSIFDGSGAAIFPGEVLVEGNRIRAVAKGNRQIGRDGVEIVDGGGATLMPGLVEAHAHLSWPCSIDRKIDTLDLPPEEHLLITAHNAKVLLEHGFTSSYSAGSLGERFEVALREEFNAGWLAGPRLVASSLERAPDRNDSGGVGPSHDADHGRGPEAMRRYIREVAVKGVNSCKFLISSDDAFEPDGSRRLLYSDDELAAAGAQARETGVWLSCDAQANEAVRMALRHGFRVLYHCSYADDETLDMIEAKKAEIFVGPAVGIAWANIHFGERAGLPPAVAKGSEFYLERLCQVFPKMRKRGIRVLPGGDYGFAQNPNGENARDFQLFVDLFGYTPTEVLVAATKLGGELMNLELGQVRQGFLADLIIVAGDPVRDIKLFQDQANILTVMKDGRFYRRAAVVPTGPKMAAAATE